MNPLLIHGLNSLLRFYIPLLLDVFTLYYIYVLLYGGYYFNMDRIRYIYGIRTYTLLQSHYKYITLNIIIYIGIYNNNNNNNTYLLEVLNCTFLFE